MPKNIVADNACPWTTWAHPQSPDTITLRAEVSPQNPTVSLALVSDMHIDNPHFDGALWDMCVEEIKRRNAGVLYNGDTFDAMQARNDPRRSTMFSIDGTGDDAYYNALVKHVHKTLKPVAHRSLVFGIGNHDINQNMDIDLLRWLVDRINLSRERSARAVATYKGKGKSRKDRNYDLITRKGGYITSVHIELSHGNTKFSPIKILMYHGTGGGGRIAKGEQYWERLIAKYPNYDVYWAGHWHYSKLVSDSVRDHDTRGPGGWSRKKIYWVQTPGFKDESIEPDSWAKRMLIHQKVRGMWFLDLTFIDRTTTYDGRQRFIDLRFNELTRA